MKPETVKRAARWTMALGLLAMGLILADGAMNPARADQPDTIEEAPPEQGEHIEGEDTEPVVLRPVTPPVPALPGELPPYVAPADLEIHDDILVSPTRGGANSPWPGGIVPVVFDGITSEEAFTYLIAMDMWNYSNANVTFIFRGSEADYIRFMPTTDSNSSSVGMEGGEQALNVNDPDIGTALHELGHALGFYHEQSRPDRDDFVEIICGNVDPNRYSNFTIHDEWVFPILTSYDYESIMHYSECKSTVCDDLLGVCPCIGDCESGEGEGDCVGGTCEHNGRTIVTLDEDFQDVIGHGGLSTTDVVDMQNGYGIGGRNKRYVQAGTLPVPNAIPGLLFPSGSPRDVMVLHPDYTIWVLGGTYTNAMSAGVYSSPGILRAHGGSAVLGGG